MKLPVRAFTKSDTRALSASSSKICSGCVHSGDNRHCTEGRRRSTRSPFARELVIVLADTSVELPLGVIETHECRGAQSKHNGVETKNVAPVLMRHIEDLAGGVDTEGSAHDSWEARHAIQQSRPLLSRLLLVCRTVSCRVEGLECDGTAEQALGGSRVVGDMQGQRCQAGRRAEQSKALECSANVGHCLVRSLFHVLDDGVRDATGKETACCTCQRRHDEEQRRFLNVETVLLEVERRCPG
mmetsp:Transcript_11426/g.31620  ORF Transcript_11426/g.31620 Transcript_11426/m.31620 type:complete len:242 (+) Transcript_11426:729-1454(+)